MLAHLGTFAAAQSPVITIAQPNIAFPGLNPDGTAKPMPDEYLRATFLPIPSTRIISGPNTHAGLLQVDVFQRGGLGPLKPGRVAAALIGHFSNRGAGLGLSRDGFTIQINQIPYRDSLVTDAPWVFIPVRIPYQCFAS